MSTNRHHTSPSRMLAAAAAVAESSELPVTIYVRRNTPPCQRDLRSFRSTRCEIAVTTSGTAASSTPRLLEPHDRGPGARSSSRSRGKPGGEFIRRCCRVGRHTQLLAWTHDACTALILPRPSHRAVTSAAYCCGHRRTAPPATSRRHRCVRVDWYVANLTIWRAHAQCRSLWSAKQL